MRRLLLRIWSLPWPQSFRFLAHDIAKRGILRRLLFPSFLVGVVGLIVNDAGELLLLEHTYRHRHPWGLPTGFLEHGEQPADALAREIHEETGFSVRLSAVWTVYSDPRQPLLSLVFRGTPEGGMFTASSEVSDARFFNLDDLPDVSPDQYRLVEYWRKREDSNQAAT